MRTTKGSVSAERGRPRRRARRLPRAARSRTATPISSSALARRSAFPGRAWIAAELPAGRRRRGAARRRCARSRAQAGLPLVAAGDVHMHVRSRRALQDVLTAIRLGVPVHAAGDALLSERRAPPAQRLRLARDSIHAELLARDACASPSAAASILERLRYEYPAELVPAGETPASYLRGSPKRARAALSRRRADQRPRAGRARARAHRRARATSLSS